MAVPYSLATLITALIVIAKAHRAHPVVPALHERFEEARKDQRKRGRAANGVSRKTLYTYVAQICEFLEGECIADADGASTFQIGAAFIAASPRSAHRYYSSMRAGNGWIGCMLVFVLSRPAPLHPLIASRTDVCLYDSYS